MSGVQVRFELSRRFNYMDFLQFVGISYHCWYSAVYLRNQAGGVAVIYNV